MTHARFLSSTITVCCGDFELRARGRILQFDGYTRALPPAGKQEDKVLPDIDKGQELTLESLEPVQHFTKPVGRFTEASSGQGTGEAGHRPALNLCLNHLDDPGPWLRQTRQPAVFVRAEGWRNCH